MTNEAYLCSSSLFSSFLYLPPSILSSSSLYLLSEPRKMAKAIISPSVLASDLSNLTAECKRMIGQGADWLHMGTFSLPHTLYTR